MFLSRMLHTVSFLMLVLLCSSALGQPNELCANLHPEAKYMTPPDKEGTQRYLAKQVEDFSGFASCFDQRYGGAFAAQDFRPCNSIPGISQKDRLHCIVNKERPKPREWCSTRFSPRRHLDMWRQCMNEFFALEDMPLLEKTHPKTPLEMKQDEQDFVENASAVARDSYRACILQFTQQSAVQRQGCRDIARSHEELMDALRGFDPR